MESAEPGDSRSISSLAQTEAAQIRAALKRTDGRIKGPGDAASLLGINPSTLWGRVGFLISSNLRSGQVEAQLDLTATSFQAPIKLRLRVPEGHEIRSVTMNGKPWMQFDAEQETITLPAKLSGKVFLAVGYQ